MWAIRQQALRRQAELRPELQPQPSAKVVAVLGDKFAMMEDIQDHGWDVLADKVQGMLHFAHESLGNLLCRTESLALNVCVKHDLWSYIGPTAEAYDEAWFQAAFFMWGRPALRPFNYMNFPFVDSYSSSAYNPVDPAIADLLAISTYQANGIGFREDALSTEQREGVGNFGTIFDLNNLGNLGHEEFDVTLATAGPDL